MLHVTSFRNQVVVLLSLLNNYQQQQSLTLMAFTGTDVETCPRAVKNILSRLSASIAAPQMLLTGSLKHFHQLSTVLHYAMSSAMTGLLRVLMI